MKLLLRTLSGEEHVVLLLSMLMTVLVVGPADIGLAPLPGSQSVIYDTDATQRLFMLVNQARAEAGLPPLAWNDELSQAARRHTAAMAEHQQLSHQLADEPGFAERLATVKIVIRSAGENVARAESSERAHSLWMRSPGHRDNVLNREYDSIGIAAVRCGRILYLTEDFASRVPQSHRKEVVTGFKPPASDAEATEAVAEQVGKLLRAPDGNMAQRKDVPLQPIVGQMEMQDQLSGSAALSLAGARHALAFNVADPTKLPAEVRRLALIHEAGSYAVGASFSRTAKHPRGVYWVLVVLFASDLAEEGGASNLHTAALAATVQPASHRTETTPATRVDQ